MHKCVICNNTAYRSKDNKFYCNKHYGQLYVYGKILERTKFDPNEYNFLEDRVEILIYKKDKVFSVFISLESSLLVKNFKLYLRKDGYVAFKNNEEQKTYLLHRYLMGNPKGKVEVDHINRNKLDNRLENLRIVPLTINRINSDMMKNNTSGVIGVTWDKSRKKWKSSLNIDSKCYNLGRFDTLEEASQARREAEEKYHNQFLTTKRRNKDEKPK